MNRRPANYHTKQGEAILAYLASRNKDYVTAAQVVEHFQSGNGLIGRTTVYRRLERLVQEGKVRKYIFDGALGACFRYVEQPESESDFYHLKCDVCGGIFSLQCDEVGQVSRHIMEVHAFEVNDRKTVFYGKCQMCLQGSSENGQF